MKLSKKDEKKLQELAEIVANTTCTQISSLVKTPTMSYKTQWILEAVITILQCRV